MSKLSVNEFRKLLREEVERICSERGWHFDSGTERGFAFQYWLAEMIARYEVGFDGVDPAEACLLCKDLGADLVLEDSTRQHFLIVQAKYQGFDKLVSEGEVNDFFHRHRHFSNRQWVINHGSPAASEALADYGEKLRNGYSATYYFVSTGSASDRTKQIAETVTASYEADGVPIRCELFDFAGLKEYYVRSLSLEESGPPEVVFRLPMGRFFEKPDPLPTLVAVLKGNELRGLYQRFKEALYVWNIRGYLGNRGINHEIFNTATRAPEHFFYYNNGVSAICTKFEIRDTNELHIQNLQVINGAQTISSLAKAEAHPDIDVLFRLTRTTSVKTEKGLNRDIIQYNNTQNAIKVSDFRSNDEIQLWLENRFKRVKATSVLPNLFYLRKRSVGRKGTGYGVKLEELAKIRYSYLKEPTLVHASPRALWSMKEDDGVYEISFGVDGELMPTWSENTFNELLLALALYLHIDSEVVERGKKDPELRFLRRLRYHALALAGSYLRDRPDVPVPSELIHSKTEFGALWKTFWGIGGGILTDSYLDAMNQETSMFAFVRSEKAWDQMRKKLKLRMSVAT